MALLCWNVKGFNSLVTQLEIREIVLKNSIDYFTLLETKIKPPNAQGIRDFFGDAWDSLNNESENHPEPISIWIFWKKGLWSVENYKLHSQFIHTSLTNSVGYRMIVSAVYGKSLR